jgi:hypothetical protein
MADSGCPGTRWTTRTGPRGVFSVGRFRRVTLFAIAAMYASASIPLGTHSDNMRDAAEKGRIRIPQASYASDETHQPAKLTNDQVRVIRSAERRRGVAARLAREFGVSLSAVCHARAGHTFKDVR